MQGRNIFVLYILSLFEFILLLIFSQFYAKISLFQLHKPNSSIILFLDNNSLYIMISFYIYTAVKKIVPTFPLNIYFITFFYYYFFKSKLCLIQFLKFFFNSLKLKSSIACIHGTAFSTFLITKPFLINLEYNLFSKILLNADIHT